MRIDRHEPEAGVLSNVVGAGGFVYTAGSVADNLDLDVEGQTREALAYIDQMLARCGTDKSKVVFATIWLADIRLRDAMNKAWLAWVDKGNLPARACIEAKMANPAYLVEIAVVAAR
ncbi:MAG TPA: RidA family protein [Hyphomicrobiaceae bacterium]|nr:RidA family protein [Hyphomicrobiaceae bacterium]